MSVLSCAVRRRAHFVSERARPVRRAWPADRVRPRGPFAWRLVALALALLCAACGDDGLDTTLREINETHFQGGGTVDILFVVDSSGSMGEEQAALAEGFEDFIQSFLELETDFHIGVTDMDYLGTAGRLLGTPAYLTRDTENLVETFQDRAVVGITGSGTEKGLESARMALGAARAAMENRGFHREAATLVLIFVSDEDDQSSASDEEYEQFFLDLKYGDRRRLSINAIAGPTPDGCETAEPGTRYETLANAFGGRFSSICASDLGMPQLGAILSGFRTSFTLGAQPQPDSAIVYVNGEEVPPGPDTWQQVDDQIRFARGAWPEDCAEIQVSYLSTQRPGSNPNLDDDVALAPLCAQPSGVDPPDRPDAGGCSTLPSSSSGSSSSSFVGLGLVLFAFGRRRRAWSRSGR